VCSYQCIAGCEGLLQLRHSTLETRARDLYRCEPGK
jgi:hypothetical protein